MSENIGNGCWNCKHEAEDDNIYCMECVSCDWFDNWKPNASGQTPTAERKDDGR